MLLVSQVCGVGQSRCGGQVSDSPVLRQIRARQARNQSKRIEIKAKERSSRPVSRSHEGFEAGRIFGRRARARAIGLSTLRHCRSSGATIGLSVHLQWQDSAKVHEEVGETRSARQDVGQVLLRSAPLAPGNRSGSELQPGPRRIKPMAIRIPRQRKPRPKLCRHHAARAAAVPLLTARAGRRARRARS